MLVLIVNYYMKWRTKDMKSVPEALAGQFQPAVYYAGTEV